MLRHPFFIKCGQSPLIGRGSKALNPGGTGAKPPPPRTGQRSETEKRQKLLLPSEAGRPLIMHCNSVRAVAPALGFCRALDSSAAIDVQVRSNCFARPRADSDSQARSPQAFINRQPCRLGVVPMDLLP